MTGFWAWFHDGWEIVGALASAFAAGVALWLASRERADRKAAEDDRDEAREAQRRAEMAEARREREAQARQVVVIAERYNANGPTVPVRITVGNYSTMPVSDVAVYRRTSDSDEQVAFTFALKDPVRETATTIPMDPGDEAYATFQDAAGSRWRRFTDGRLEAESAVD